MDRHSGSTAMTIDGIGRGGPPPKLDGQPVHTKKAGGTAFVVPSKPGATTASPASGGMQATAATDSAQILEQVRSGKMTLNAYMDVRVGEAVEHLNGALTPDQMEFIKVQLRNQLQDDPVLTDLVRRATGQRPEPTES